jgi:hypothetical protein
MLEGAPGTGKSWWAVGDMIEQLMAGRLIYTNLPLRWRVFDAFCKARGLRPGLVRPLTEKHFRAFLDRFRSRSDEMAATTGVRRWKRRSASEAWKDRVDGVDPNWIPADSAIYIDEIHRWFPQSEQSRETPNLQQYVTMHRHLNHRITLITQHRMQVSITFRRLCAEMVQLRKVGEVWKFVGLGIDEIIPGLFFSDIVRPDLDGKDDHFISRDLNCLYLHQYRFRLYDSHTHLGNLQELQLEASKLATHYDPSNPIKPRKGGMSFAERALYVGAIASLVCFGRYIWAPQVADEPSPMVLAPDIPPTPTRVGSLTAAVAGRDVRLGGRVGEWLLVALDPANNSCDWQHDDQSIGIVSSSVGSAVTKSGSDRRRDLASGERVP